MAILFVLAAGVGIALVRGGNLDNLARLHPRYLWLFFLPLGLQMVAFSPIGSSPEFGLTLVKLVYLASMAIAALALALNWRLPGLIWVAVGLMSNFIVIASNGGLMPVSADARQFSGMPPLTGPNLNVLPMTPETALPWLGDILPLPSWMPLANVYSVGDVLITIGGLIFIQKALVPSRPEQVESNS